jgi:hypothetical protein
MSIFDEFVNNLTEQERRQILIDNAQFEKDGFIGECLLRDKAKEAYYQIGFDGNISLAMAYLVNYIFRYYTRLYNTEHPND